MGKTLAIVCALRMYVLRKVALFCLYMKVQAPGELGNSFVSPRPPRPRPLNFRLLGK